MDSDMKILFFGAGKQGKYCLKVFKDYGITPDGILDNNKNLHGKTCENIIIYNPDILSTVSFECIFITCNNVSEIYFQLLDLGVEKKKIVTGYHNILNHLIYYSTQKTISVDKIDTSFNKTKRQKIIFDLQNGMVLGGVESWSYELAKELRKNSYSGMYLTTDAADSVVTDNVYPIYTLKNRELENEKDRIKLCVQKIIEYLPCTIICNFPQQIFWSSCIVKQLYPNQIRIIAVQHSDDELYYEVYSLWQNAVDKFMIISSQMRNKLLSLGMEKDKICYLKWKVFCEEKLMRTWSKEGMCLQIGYAGRVTTIAKRIDLFVTLAKKLKLKNIQFQVSIAGIGDYSETLQKKICDENLQEYIVLLGYIDRKDIPDFWCRQDIMVSCSEREGHSISQSEAMAAGAVPVITDVSGARDDVADGCNGFLVDVGDIDAIVDKICFLYHNRDQLEQMGRCAHDTIYERQKGLCHTEFWDSLIEGMWQQ